MPTKLTDEQRVRAAGEHKAADYRFYASESGEGDEGERISADKILREIHDSMCMCGVWDDCGTEGINGTLIEAAHGIISVGKWSHDFEDGWIKVETIQEAAHG